MHDHAPPSAGLRRTRNALHGVYGLYALSFVFGVTLLAGVVIAYLKRDDATGTVYRRHLDCKLRTFWVTVVVGAVGVIERKSVVLGKSVAVGVDLGGRRIL